jgi:Carboxypeptidase regulatory-like domain
MDKKSKVALGVLSLGAVITAVVLATRQTKATPTGSTTLSGAVTDTIMNTGIAGVLITLGNLSVYSDSTGKYTFPDVSQYIGQAISLDCTKTGYKEVTMPITLYAGENTHQIGMTPLAPPQAVFDGVVTDATTGLPLSGVGVGLSGANGSKTTTTDGGGNFSISVPPGTYSAVFHLNGYVDYIL